MSVRAFAIVVLLAVTAACGRADRQAPELMRKQIAELEAEREKLKARMEELVAKDPRMAGMPDTPVRIGVPTSLSRDLIQRVISGFVDQVTLELNNIKVRKRGTVRKVVTLGDYDLQLTINKVSGKIKTGTPEVTFGGNAVKLAMPLSVISGGGQATIRFIWDGRTVAGTVCGDLDVTQVVTGNVRPRTYPVGAGLELTATATEILAAPKFPLIRINLGVIPSDSSWAAAQKILDDKTGMCGFVLDRVDVLALVRKLIDRGFNVRLPTEKIKSAAIPVAVEPTMMVRGTPVAMGIRVGDLAITEQVIWLGAHVSVAVGEEALAKEAAAAAAKAAPPAKKAAPARKAAAPPPLKKTPAAPRQ